MRRRKLTLPTSYEFALALDGSLVAALGRGIAIADLRTGTRVGSWSRLKHPSSAAFNSDAGLLVVKNTSGEIAMLRTMDGVVLARSKPCGEGASIHFSACDDYVVDGSWSGSIRVRSAADLTIESTFKFPDEMIQAASTSADGKSWMFAHHPRESAFRGAAPPPYFSLWNWPLARPQAMAPLGLEIIRSATLSPCGTRIAVAGYCRPEESEQLRLLDLAGNLLCGATLPNYARSRVRFSPSGRLVGVAAGAGIHVFSASSLERRAEIAAEYPSDLAFIDDDANLLVGTWNSGRIVPLDAVS